MAERNVKTILDTNALLRFLVGDIDTHFEEVKSLFRRAENGELQLVIFPVVVAEAVYVLEKFYKKSINEIVVGIEGILVQPWLEIEHEKALTGMWKWYLQGMHFVDSYLIALREYEGMEVFSFDKKLKRKLERR